MESVLPLKYRAFCCDGVAAFYLPNKSFADRAIAYTWEIACHASRVGWQQVAIYWQGCDRPYRIPASLAAAGKIPSGVIPHYREVRSLSDIEWDKAIAANTPIYISRLDTQSNLFANNAAIACQQIEPERFLSDRAFSLNFPDELERRCKAISRDGGLHEYEYEALRWCEIGGELRRKRLKFTSNFS